MNWNSEERLPFLANGGPDYHRAFLAQGPRMMDGQPLEADLRLREIAERAIRRQERREAEAAAERKALLKGVVFNLPELKRLKECRRAVHQARKPVSGRAVPQAERALRNAEERLIDEEVKVDAGLATEIDVVAAKRAREQAAAALEEAKRDVIVSQRILPLRKKMLTDAERDLDARLEQMRAPLAQKALKAVQKALAAHDELFELEREIEKNGIDRGSARCFPLERESIRKWVTEIAARFG